MILKTLSLKKKKQLLKFVLQEIAFLENISEDEIF